MTGAERIAAERERQIEKEGWTAEHDATHGDGELTQAAACYLLTSNRPDANWTAPPTAGVLWPRWPWERDAWKPSADLIRNLEKAGALIAAEIDRLATRQAQAERVSSKLRVEDARDA